MLIMWVRLHKVFTTILKIRGGACIESFRTAKDVEITLAPGEMLKIWVSGDEGGWEYYEITEDKDITISGAATLINIS